MMDIFSDASKLLGLLEPEDANKTLLRNKSNSFTLDTGRVTSHKTSNFTNSDTTTYNITYKDQHHIRHCKK